LLFKINWRNFPGSLLGPDSLLPRPKDVKDFFQHIGWFLGFAKPPQFDRWGYWEKFDYWAVFWGIPLLGITGLLLAYPLAFSRIMPGWGLNIAFWIHRIEAILAMCHVFVIHFFIAHLRRHNFPMDRTMFEGSADFEAARHEKPVWVSRMEAAGRMSDVLVPEAGVGRRVISYVIGYLAVACGVFLLIGGLVNSPYITW
jgi:cytochrome b subunit of formate dehydrogenase